jgi:hypothetical protein
MTAPTTPLHAHIDNNKTPVEDEVHAADAEPALAPRTVVKFSFSTPLAQQRSQLLLNSGEAIGKGHTCTSMQQLVNSNERASFSL